MEKINFKEMQCDVGCARSFRRLLADAGVLTGSVMGTCRPGDSLHLRNGAWLKVRSIRRDRSKPYDAYLVVFVGLIGIQFEYDAAGASMDSEFVDGDPAPFDVVLVERCEIVPLRGRG